MSTTPTTSSKPRKPAKKTRAKHPFDNDRATVAATRLQEHPKDSEAMGDFYTLLKPMVDRALSTKFARGADESTRQDLSQDILLKLMHKLPQFDKERASLFNWATAIIRTTVVDYYRKANREVPSDLTPNSATAPEHVQVDAEVLSEMRAFFPFPVSTRVFHDLFAAAERYRFRVNNNLTGAIAHIFNENKIDYRAYGTLADYAQFIVMLYRIWVLPEDDLLWRKLEEAVEKDPNVGPLRLLNAYLNKRQLCTLLHLCGGMSIKLPSPKRLLERVDPPTR
jgi:RNA polymerase sigma factor (sigma-70 family)